MGSQQRDAVRDVLAPVLARQGLRLDDVAISPAGSRRLLRVVIDLSDEAVDRILGEASEGPPAHAPGLSLDAVADASRAVSGALDESDVMGEAAYVLEVTTPGVDRPLTTPAQFRRNVRRKVTVTLADGTEVTGRLEQARDALVLRVEGAKKGMTSVREYPWADVVRGVVQVDFARVDEVPLVDLGNDDETDEPDDADHEDDVPGNSTDGDGLGADRGKDG
jgi:ribosome maturation factor RimP